MSGCFCGQHPYLVYTGAKIPLFNESVLNGDERGAAAVRTLWERDFTAKKGDQEGKLGAAQRAQFRRSSADEVKVFQIIG